MQIKMDLPFIFATALLQAGSKSSSYLPKSSIENSPKGKYPLLHVVKISWKNRVKNNWKISRLINGTWKGYLMKNACIYSAFCK